MLWTTTPRIRQIILSDPVKTNNRDYDLHKKILFLTLLGDLGNTIRNGYILWDTTYEKNTHFDLFLRRSYRYRNLE